MLSDKKQVCVAVVGSGVTGLSSAIRLQERGFDVTIFASDFPPNTTSDAAAAYWYPYNVGANRRVLDWALATFDEYVRLAEMPGSSVFLSPFYKLYAEESDDAWWVEGIKQCQRLEPGAFGCAYEVGYQMEVPLAETTTYMGYLMGRFVGGGGQFQRVVLQNLDEVPDAYSLIVNCAGVQARALLGDKAVYPIRGQVLRVVRPEGLERFIVSYDQGSTKTYIIQRSKDVILGGTAEVDDWNLEADPATAEAIRERCIALVPALKDATVLEHKVGLRPGRKEVRLDLEPLAGDRAVIHNYGHGGAGFTLSWGCAAEVADRAEAFCMESILG
ncbi:MAG TPA: FAD-dependent oxidoreductase [Rhodothermales bacterium]|nr:FAD-dependent oxidoreductase [Rhodothermales bacterium]